MARDNGFIVFRDQLAQTQTESQINGHIRHHEGISMLSGDATAGPQLNILTNDGEAGAKWHLNKM